jgi:hypothetical protein
MKTCNCEYDKQSSDEYVIKADFEHFSEELLVKHWPVPHQLKRLQGPASASKGKEYAACFFPNC